MGGRSRLVGVDEVGRGSWAGPVTVCAVVGSADLLASTFRSHGSDPANDLADVPGQFRDSKSLTARMRVRAAKRVLEEADSVGIGHAEPSEIDELGMTGALGLATERALAALSTAFDVILLDGTTNYIGDAYGKVVLGAKGDTRSSLVAAASTFAKVTRDALMVASASDFPYYAFDENKGYASAYHIRAIHGYGPSIFHRTSWSWTRDLQPKGFVRRMPSSAPEGPS